MTDILDNPFDPFADAVEATLKGFRTEISGLRGELTDALSEVRSLKAELETRSAPVTHPIAHAEPINGKDGVGVAGVHIREGNLFVRLTDGSEHDAGRVVGSDGKDGENGRDGVDGKNGLDGKDGERGTDGIATREEIEAIATRAVETRFADVQVRSFADTYQDVFKHGQTYNRGHTATWEGSLWLALRDTNAQPGTQDSGWKLVTKRGRDGRDKR
jgi:hypothetical protein